MDKDSNENQENCCVKEDDTTVKSVGIESTTPTSRDDNDSQGISDANNKDSESQLSRLKEGMEGPILLATIKTEDGGSDVITTAFDSSKKVYTEEEDIVDESEKESSSSEKVQDPSNGRIQIFGDFSFSSNNEKETETDENAVSVSTKVTEVIVVEAKNFEDPGIPSPSAEIAHSDSAYREKPDESCDSSSDSEDSVIFVQEEEKCIVIESDDQEENKSRGKKESDIRTKGEVYPEELPPLEELIITVDPNVELVHTGTITGIVGCLVIVKANQNIPPLNENTILFLEGRIVLGQIFEVFGPVGSPWYSLRFNSHKDIEKKSISCGQKVYCAPKVENLTNYVFVEHLRMMKGSDASWEDNNEPPEKYIDYSDDEEERRAKAKARNRGNEQEDGDQLPGVRKVRRRRQKDRESVQQNGTEDTNSVGSGSGTHNKLTHGNRREFYNNQSNRGRNFNQRGGRQQNQPRMEYQSFQPFGAPPRFPQTPETQNNPVMYQNGGPVRQPIFQPRYPDPNPPQNWNNQSQPQSNWNPNTYTNTSATQTMNYPYSGPNQNNGLPQNGGHYYPQFSGVFSNMSVPPPPHCFGQPPPVFNRQMMTDKRYIQNPAFQQNQGSSFDPNVPPPNYNVG